MSARRFLRWAVAATTALAVLALAGAGAVWLWARPDRPDAFYTPPAGAPTEPGALIRAESSTRGVPADARGWRILYATTRHDGRPAVASALVVVPATAGAAPFRVVAWTHGTTGVAPGCAPSLFPAPFAGMGALPLALDRGWAIVATDYEGLGTAGSHPYLIGLGEARSALDAIRAARQLPGLRLADGVVVWGHSQGGGAALWTGLVAPAYAPDVRIAGVAAAAPASDLPALLEQAQHTLVGRMLSSYVMRAYADAYPDVAFDAYVRPSVQPLARDMARRCMSDRRALVSAVEARIAGATIFAQPPSLGPLGLRLAQNTPQGRLTAPVLIAQGLADDLILPGIQDRFVAAWRAQGQQLDYRTYAGRDHLSLVAPDAPFTSELIGWTRDRFEEAADPRETASAAAP